ncbi:hypothetical protein E4U43_005075 [Claviceps pusilla]|uniref:Uncharacterized protein n=1 Tax=Claviceps pusilla TaxID=123648 RepID=A0A9P7SZ36_9HYPO|nr:hypothetical protein E4U43_005075 [Claviceps pusilla]
MDESAQRSRDIGRAGEILLKERRRMPGSFEMVDDVSPNKVYPHASHFVADCGLKLASRQHNSDRSGVSRLTHLVSTVSESLSHRGYRTGPLRKRLARE